MKRAGVRLVVVEAMFGQRVAAVSDLGTETDYQVTITDEIWHKENLINIGMQRALRPQDEYVAWIDCDIYPDPAHAETWAVETIEALQHYAVIQPWSDCTDRAPNGTILHDHQGRAIVWRSFGSIWAQTGQTPSNASPHTYAKQGFGHPGYAWAARREALDKLGGLIDRAVLGAGDHHMALSLLGVAQLSVPAGLQANYYAMVYDWQKRATQWVKKNLGFAAISWNHEWHGKKQDRQYESRWQILQKYQFDPVHDLVADTQGALHLSEEGLRMRDAFRRYYRARAECSVDVGAFPAGG